MKRRRRCFEPLGIIDGCNESTDESSDDDEEEHVRGGGRGQHEDMLMGQEIALAEEREIIVDGETTSIMEEQQLKVVENGWEAAPHFADGGQEPFDFMPERNGGTQITKPELLPKLRRKRAWRVREKLWECLGGG